jgi:hypothetical protein
MDEREGAERLERDAEQSTEEHLEEDVAEDLDLEDDREGEPPDFDEMSRLPPD